MEFEEIAIKPNAIKWQEAVIDDNIQSVRGNQLLLAVLTVYHHAFEITKKYTTTVDVDATILGSEDMGSEDDIKFGLWRAIDQLVE